MTREIIIHKSGFISKLQVSDEIMKCRVEDGIESLLLASLISQDPESTDLSVHRVLQEENRKWLGYERRPASFKKASKLLLNAFPHQNDGQSMHPVWFICRKYISHVVALADLFEMNSYKDLPPEQFHDFIELCLYAAWYVVMWRRFSALTSL